MNSVKIKILGLFLSIMTIGVFADANICSSNWLAAASGSDVNAFINAGADPNGICTTIRNRPLHQALLTPGVDESVIEALIRSGARVDTRNLEGDTPFDLAEERFARAGSPQSGRERAIYDAVMGSLETDQFTAVTDAHNQLCDLGWWRRSGSGPAVQGFLDIGADPDHRCGNGDRIIQVPLRLTAFRLLPEGVFWGIKALVDAGANLTIRNAAGESALDMAERRYGLVTARIIREQRRWCNSQIVIQQLLDEATRNASDTSAYLFIKSSATNVSEDQLSNDIRMELFNTTEIIITKNVVCPYRGINNYR